MVPVSRTPLRADRLRALNLPQPALVEVDAAGHPAAVAWDGKRRAVESIVETWRLDDEWWRRAPIRRRYAEVVLENGKRVVLFEDLATGAWHMQLP